MATHWISDQVVSYMEPGRQYNTVELAKAVGLRQAQDIAPTLRDLEHDGKVQQIRGAPYWRKNRVDRMKGRSPLGRGRGRSAQQPQRQPVPRRVDNGPSHGTSDNLRSRVLEALRGYGSPVTALQVAKQLGFPSRRSVNPTLYALEREGVISMTQDTGPPVWSIGSPRSSISRPPTNTSACVLENTEMPGAANSSESTADLGQRLLQVLARSPQPQTTLQLAQAVGSTRGTIGPALRMLERERHIAAVPGSSPQMWFVGNSLPSPLQPSTNQLQQLPFVRVDSDGIDSQADAEGERGIYPVPPAPANERVMMQTVPDDDDDDITCRRLMEVLRASPQLTALELAKKMDTTRSNINPVLYNMEKQGIIKATKGNMPPRWSLYSNHGGSVPFRSNSSNEDGSIEDEPGREEDHSGQEEDNIEGQQPPSVFAEMLAKIPLTDMRGRLLCVLQSDVTVLRTELELARIVGLNSRHEVLPILLQLESEGLTLHTTGLFPVKWGAAVSSETDTSANVATCAAVQVPVCSGVYSGSGLIMANTIAEDVTRNPISRLTEYCQSKKHDLVLAELREYGPPHRKTFVVAAQFAGLSFEAESTSKKEARRMAADLALQALLANQGQDTQCMQPLPALTLAGSITGDSFHDRIARLSHEFYLQVQNTLNFPQPGRKVTACIIMEDTALGQFVPVAVGSGTRCITGDHMSLEGLVVNDSHAEIIARRSLLRYLYQQLHAFHQGSSNSIFCASSDHNLPCVKETIKFHLYISTAPCGDGAQFSRGDTQNREPPNHSNGHQPTMSSKTQGVLRTKMEGGEGTIPVEDAPPQTWDGILHGGRLRTMSCSDKVGRWNVVGLQGALLSHFVRPVYLSSLTLGSLHHHGHLSRAVCCRFNELTADLPDGFSVHHPLLGRVQGGDEMKRHTEKACSFSMNWAKGDVAGELNDGGSGRPVPPSAMARAQLSLSCSRVCKANLFAQFVELCRLTKRTELFEGKSYKEAKAAAVNFQNAKLALYKLCEQKGYGSWMRKPAEQEQFDITILDRLEQAGM